jgi:hypothetical protein
LTQTSPIGGGSRERLGVSQMLDHLGGNVFTPKSTGIFFGAHAPETAIDSADKNTIASREIMLNGQVFRL